MNAVSSRTAALFGVATLSLLAACSTTPPPKEQMAVSRASVERASGPAAAEAPLELAAARDKLERANVAMANKDYDQARRLAQEADAEAALAEAKARSTRSERALVEVRESIRQLREQATQAAASRG
jgi:hypothetical protein